MRFSLKKADKISRILCNSCLLFFIVFGLMAIIGSGGGGGGDSSDSESLGSIQELISIESQAVGG